MLCVSSGTLTTLSAIPASNLHCHRTHRSMSSFLILVCGCTNRAPGTLCCLFSHLQPTLSQEQTITLPDMRPQEPGPLFLSTNNVLPQTSLERYQSTDACHSIKACGSHHQQSTPCTRPTPRSGARLRSSLTRCRQQSHALCVFNLTAVCCLQAVQLRDLFHLSEAPSITTSSHTLRPA